MRHVIIDYKKLSPEHLKRLAEQFPYGYSDKDIIRFDDHHNHTIEAIELRTDNTVYLVKIHSKLHYTLTNFSKDTIPEVDDDAFDLSLEARDDKD